MAGPQVPFCDSIGADKYRLPDESFEEACKRVSTTLADSIGHEAEFNDILRDMRFLPAGRVLAGAGAPKRVTLFNCYVSGTIHDSFVDGPDAHDPDPDSISIMESVTQAVRTMRQGGGIGFDFSTIRPSGDVIKGVQATTDGPLAFMPLHDAACRATSSSGNRRGALMGTLRVDHPDILKFVKAKRNEHALRGFNISIGVTDAFMRALTKGEPFPLKFGGKVYQMIDPNELWEQVMESTWDWAEPGVLFMDTINRENNLWYCEKIATTNPCGEQPLPPYGACLLGSFNLVKYVTKGNGRYYLDMDRLKADIPAVVRAMDNVVDLSIYPLEKQSREAKNKRRMGLGITGVANALEAMGAPYGSFQYTEMQSNILRNITESCYKASIALARTKGAFPAFDAELYSKGKFIQRLPDEIQDGIKRFGIRNSHLTSIAPTGTISMYADNVSSGIEPVFAINQRREVLMPEGKRTIDLQDYGFRVFGVKPKTTANVTLKEHLGVLLSATKHIDSAVSKTCNVDDNVTYDGFKSIYTDAWEGGAKGCTTFNKKGKRGGILTDTDTKKEEAPAGEACYYDPSTGQKSCG